MNSTFEEYDVILKSGLFDPDFYTRAYPDVAALGSDPLLHYIEVGARELRNPNDTFDAKAYSLQHQNEGREPANPLLHFIAFGATLDAPVSPGKAGELKLNIDRPLLINGTVDHPIQGNLEIIGWALARDGVTQVEIAIDDKPATSAFLGIRRPDVEKHFPHWPGAITAGFSALVHQRSLEAGRHRISVTLKDAAARSQSIAFFVNVENESEQEGPWSLATPQAAAAGIWNRLLARSEWRPQFNIVVSVPSLDAATLERANNTLASIDSQNYAHFRIFVLTPKGIRGDRLMTALTQGHPRIESRLEVVAAETPAPTQGPDSSTGAPSYYVTLLAGDVLAPDALLEFAAETGQNRNAGLIYADDRRPNPASGGIEAYFKPDWSPDLLLSSNYIGRAWCAKDDLIRRAAVKWADLAGEAAYALLLRLTEHTSAIAHLTTVLMECPEPHASQESERRALEQALTRRGIRGTVEDGPTLGIFRARRATAIDDLVSIIIPTCAARGLIKTCIETIKRHTRYRNFEIVCIENIPDNLPQWKIWLGKNADKVITTSEPFNWSQYNNQGAAAASGEILLFLNDDIEITDEGWLDGLLEHAQRPEIGIVGPKLVYPDQRIQHAGMFLAAPGVGRHAFRYLEKDALGYFGLAQSQRNVIAVTGACLMTRKSVFEALGGFDENHAIVNNDLDYCLRVWQAGLNTVYTPHVTLIHHEQASRVAISDIYDVDAFTGRWQMAFAKGDPFYNPSLSCERDDFSYEWEALEQTHLGSRLPDRGAIRSILVVKLDHIGDCVLALPAIRRLKRYFPAAKISVLSSRSSRPIWEMEGAIDEIIEFDFFFPRSSMGMLDLAEAELDDLQSRLVPYSFDLAIDLRKHLETRPLLQRTGARLLCGYDSRGKYPWLDIALEWPQDLAGFRKRSHAAEDLINLVAAIDAALEPQDNLIANVASLAVPALPDKRLFMKPVICVHASAGNPTKQWPVNYFIDLIDLLTKHDDVHIAIIGGPDDVELVDTIVPTLKRQDAVWSLAGVLSLEMLPGFLASCALFVGNDSGPKHIAAGLGIPTIGIHSGTVDVREWGPVGPLAIGVSRNVGCSPCYRSKIEDCHRQLACLTGISPGAIYRLCSKLLKLGMPIRNSESKVKAIRSPSRSREESGQQPIS